MTIPRLSICIATLNRGSYIGATLDSIIAQATQEVEIVVVDGASTDNTEAVVRQRQQVFPQLNYLRLAAKGGVDQDYCRAVEAARGEYCWLLSDDDFVKPDAVQAVLDATLGGYCLIVVNSEMRTFDLSAVMDPQRLPISADRVYPPGDYRRLFVDVGFYLSFIGAVVIRRAVWNERDKQSYLGTEFVHVGVIFQHPLPGATLVLSHPWLALRYGNSLWSPRYFEIWMLKWPRLIWSFGDYAEAERQQVYAREPWRNLKTLFILRAQGVYSIREYSGWLRPLLPIGPFRFAAALVARLPGCVVNLLVLIYFAVIRRTSPLRLAELRDSRFYYRRCLPRRVPERS